MSLHGCHGPHRDTKIGLQLSAKCQGILPVLWRGFVTPLVTYFLDNHSKVGLFIIPLFKEIAN
jgi:hypothetical protein